MASTIGRVNKLSVDIRKLQQTPDGTFFLSVPKAWAKRFNLTKSSMVYIHERSDGCLVLDPQYTEETSPEISLPVTDRVEDDILSSYLLGYEIITLNSDRIGTKDRERIKSAINRLVGVEIVEETPKKVVLQCLLKASAFSPDKILRREYVLSSGLFREALASFASSDRTLAESVLERDEEVDRLYFLLVRLLRTLILNPRLGEKLSFSLIDCLDYRLIASLMENIADQAVELSRLTLRLRGRKLEAAFAKRFLELGEAVKQSYDEVVKAIFSREERVIRTANEKLQHAERILDDVEANLGRLGEQLPEAYSAAPLFRRILDYLSDMVDLVTPKRRL